MGLLFYGLWTDSPSTARQHDFFTFVVSPPTPCLARVPATVHSAALADLLEEEIIEVEFHPLGRKLTSMPVDQVLGHEGAERDRRVGDGTLRAEKRHGVAVVVQPALLVPPAIEGFDGEESEPQAANTTIQVELNIWTALECLPDVLACTHAVDARNHD